MQAWGYLHGLDELCGTFGVVEIDVRAFTGLLEVYRTSALQKSRNCVTLLSTALRSSKSKSSFLISSFSSSIKKLP